MEALVNNVFDCALVFEGGGYRASYTSGIANVLLEQGIYFDYACGLSAGASNTINYLSRDRRRVRDSFMVDQRTRNAVGIRSLLHGKGYFDADALYAGALADDALPFDWEAFSANPARARIQAFERDTGRTVCFCRKDMSDLVRTINLVRASSTLPGAMTPLPIDGRVLYDGGMGTGAGIPICMAEDDGFKRFFFVASRPCGYRKEAPTNGERRMYARVAKDHPYLRNALLTRWERYNAALEHVEELAEEGRALIVYPDEMPVSSTTTSPKKLAAAYEAGHAQGVKEIGRWREFLFGAPDAGPPAGPETPAEPDGYVTIE
ncbi:patatin-like phospholipase family protein [Thermophilibacter immobilis]|jgi:predicted patatin/cPLA2 family phospholipase|uniref:Patatin family protein n=1 Tax=Thermophilibacter immobilis TaxID=2779519 RepID=A0A7S7RU08_9ACTN|nr:patatin family protein [Thermophilibacter immobilis]QOY60751.1 patatin family protein [Thermophilibacter immobilis]